MKKTFYQKEDKDVIQCLACSHHCLIANGKRGVCGVRKNDNGKLELLVYGKAVGMHLDPIEKKPLYHFLPGTKTLSFGTLGCNFRCSFCQNWQQSQLIKQEHEKLIGRIGKDCSPREIVKLALELKVPSIAYTYNEPTVFVEYALETMILAKKAGLKNVWVTNGFMSKKTREAIIPYLDAANIDLKSFNPKFYQKICGARLEPVLENIKWFYQKKIWIEIATLVIPNENDSPEELEQIATFIKDISPKIPWHISAFYPSYKMIDKPSTPLKTLLKAEQIGKRVGLRNIHLGNI